MVAAALLCAAVLESFNGALIGALLGCLGAMVWKLRSRVNQQETRLAEMAASLKKLTHKPVQPLQAASEPESRMEPQPGAVLESRTPPEPVTEAVAKSKPESESVTRGEAAVSPFEVGPHIEIDPQALVSEQSETDAQPELEFDEPQPAAAMARPVTPAAPTPFDKLKQWVIAYFTGGNLMVRVGVLILFFGVAFLLKYAAGRVSVPIEVRYLGVMVAATVLLGIGWRLRHKNAQFALVAQGGAVGILYMVVFAAYHLHGLMDTNAAFALLLCVVVLSAVIAILQNAVWLAAVGVTGGFLAPILVSSGSGNHVALFSYYLILNLGIALVAFFRSWRLLNWLGFVFTFGIGTAWGARSYHAEFFTSTEPFLLAFLALYTLLPLLFAIRQPPQLKGVVDGTLVFGTPVAFMGLQSKLAEGNEAFPNLLVWSSAALGVMYLLLAFLVWRRAAFRLLSESYIAMSVAFLTLAVPLAYDGRVTSAVWAIEGAALIWVGLRQQRLLPRLSGLGLVLVASLFYAKEPSAMDPTFFILNADYIGALLLSIAGGIAAWLFQRYLAVVTGWEKQLAPKALLLLAFAWWFGGGIHEIHRHFDGLSALGWYEGLVLITGVACWWAAVRYASLLAMGLGLITLVTGVGLLLWLHHLPASESIVVNLNTLAVALPAALSLWMGWYAGRETFPAIRFLRGLEHPLAALRGSLMWLSVALLLGEGLGQAQYFLEPGTEASYFLIYAQLLLLGFVLLHKRLQWSALTQPVLLALPLLALVMLYFVEHGYDFWAHGGWLAFPLALALLYGSLSYLEQVTDYPLGLVHLSALMVLILAFGRQLAKLFGFTTVHALNVWIIAAWGITFIAALLLVRNAADRRWPFTAYPDELGILLPRILLSLLAGWIVIANLVEPGSFGSFLNVPLFNPLDLTCLVAVLLVFKFLQRDDPEFMQADPRWAYVLPGALAFLTLNGAVLRGCHLLLDVPYKFNALFHSFAVESAISVLWASTALLVMVLATRRGWRTLWLVGGGLMGLVVLKLFVVDMTGSGSIARIVAFISVGILLLVVGYFAPVPPKALAESQDEVAV